MVYDERSNVIIFLIYSSSFHSPLVWPGSLGSWVGIIPNGFFLLFIFYFFSFMSSVPSLSFSSLSLSSSSPTPALSSRMLMRPLSSRSSRVSPSSSSIPSVSSEFICSVHSSIDSLLSDENKDQDQEEEEKEQKKGRNHHQSCLFSQSIPMDREMSLNEYNQLQEKECSLARNSVLNNSQNIDSMEETQFYQHLLSSAPASNPIQYNSNHFLSAQKINFKSEEKEREGNKRPMNPMKQQQTPSTTQSPISSPYNTKYRTHHQSSFSSPSSNSLHHTSASISKVPKRNVFLPSITQR